MVSVCYCRSPQHQYANCVSMSPHPQNINFVSRSTLCSLSVFLRPQNVRTLTVWLCPAAPPTVRIVHSGHACNVEEEGYAERVYTIREGDTLELQCLVTGHPHPQVTMTTPHRYDHTHRSLWTRPTGMTTPTGHYDHAPQVWPHPQVTMNTPHRYDHTHRWG